MEPLQQTSPPRLSPPVPKSRARWEWPLAAFLLIATFFTATTLGAAWYLFTRADVTTDLLPWLTPSAVRRVWSQPDLLRAGLNFSIPTLLILLCHELGHYLACRRYRLPATPPMFLPAPFGLGTLGAFIRIRSPIRSKRQLFDVGVSGPLAGVAALVPFLVYGLARSEAVPITTVAPSQATAFLLVPGRCLAIRLLLPWLRGPVPSGAVLDLHPWALAAWVGLLATALNLLPLGQLDGGHVLYAAVGRLQRWLALPLLALLVLAGFFWGGWWIWCVLILVMGPFHPRVVDESQPLDPRRRVLAVLALILFVLCFMPTPIAILPVSAG
jgi:membrane-associated protease RseP (regulator of RpoE activity)